MKLLKLDEFILENKNDRITLYHGTKIKFNVFDPKYMSSGWGSQEYGYGFYLTDYYECAKEYSKNGYVLTVSVPKMKYLSYNGISMSEKNNIAKKLFKHYTEIDKYGKEAYPTQETRQEFWENECKYILDCETGGNVYGTIASIIGSDKETSEFLKSIGYIGIKFPYSDGSTGKKFTNYVIFDARDIIIID